MREAGQGRGKTGKDAVHPGEVMEHKLYQIDPTLRQGPSVVTESLTGSHRRVGVGGRHLGGGGGQVAGWGGSSIYYIILVYFKE